LQHDLTVRDFLTLYMSEKKRLLDLNKSGHPLVSRPGASTRFDAHMAHLLEMAEKYSLNEAVQLILVRSYKRARTLLFSGSAFLHMAIFVCARARPSRRSRLPHPHARTYPPHLAGVL
jgi:hypothetical protein